MTRLIVRGKKKLDGTIKIGGAKNAALPIIAGSLLTKEEVTLNNIPLLQDTQMMMGLAQHIGAKIRFVNRSINLNASKLIKNEMPEAMANEIRTSVLMIGALLHRFQKLRVPLPGGCAIGERKIDLHIFGLSALGADITVNGSCIEARTKGLIGADISLDFPSVGATENIMIAACLADGASTINNAAMEPEVVDLANFLNSMGAEIKGAGTKKIKIDGVRNLTGTSHSIIPDRINTGTYMVAAAITGGEILLEGVDLTLLESVVDKLHEIGVRIIVTRDGAKVIAPDIIKPANVITDVYPGFPTDMQPIITPLLVLAEGESIIKETIFNKRFNHVQELRKMGANINIDGDTATIIGADGLRGSLVKASDLRAGAALVLAGLAAEGETTIDNAYQIDRGYENIEENLKNAGANIKRDLLGEKNFIIQDAALYNSETRPPINVDFIHTTNYAT